MWIFFVQHYLGIGIRAQSCDEGGLCGAGPTGDNLTFGDLLIIDELGTSVKHLVQPQGFIENIINYFCQHFCCCHLLAEPCACACGHDG